MSPEQLYISGNLELGRTDLNKIEGIFSHDKLQFYGAGVSDGEEYILPDNEDYDVNVPKITSDLSEELLNVIQQQIDHLIADDCFGVCIVCMYAVLCRSLPQ